jgi:S-adenosyl-L-methionine hydrolase (adenosine-forming)
LQSLIAFISDFGLEDTWVGVCHAIILRACPMAHIVDLGHQIQPFDIRKAAAMAASGVYQLPEAIHLVVVDPGVGGTRRDLCIVTGNGTRLIGPDNGVLLPAAWRAGGVSAVYSLDAVKADHEGAALPTFHARDVLAPAAAVLACGVDPSALGDPLDPDTLRPAPFGRCERADDHVAGEVLEADRFGSLRFNIPAEELDDLGLVGDFLEVGLGHNNLVVPFRKTFSDVGEGEPVVLIDSSGWLSLSVNMSSALNRYGAVPGMHVRVRAH